jgi:hypothetical protein
MKIFSVNHKWRAAARAAKRKKTGAGKITAALRTAVTLAHRAAAARGALVASPHMEKRHLIHAL